MKNLYLLVSLLVIAGSVTAHHIIGGEMSYTFISTDGRNYTYEVTLKLYRGCEPVDGGHYDFATSTGLSVFNNDNGSLFTIVNNIPRKGPYYPDHQQNDPCIISPPDVCYEIATFTGRVTVPINKKGYTVAWQRSSRSSNIINADTRGSVGATYFAVIPGTDNGIPGDNSPVFGKEEAVLICSQGAVHYSFAATDPDGDSLTYSFCSPYVGGSGADVMPLPCKPPPYQTIRYMNGFSASAPLGPRVTINPRTGEIGGRTDLKPGTYDVCVAATAHRNGRVIGVQMKDFQFEVHNCHRVALADIPPVFNDCKGMEISFSNHSTPGKSYLWNFGDGDTSTAFKPVHVFQDTGVYHIWLKVDPHSRCGDSTAAEVRVHAGPKALFVQNGYCQQSPVSFRDASATSWGRIDSWTWDFGQGDTSHMKDPSYRFADTGAHPVALTVTTDKGCTQRDTQYVRVWGKPAVHVTRDTTICSGDAVQLRAQGSAGGNYLWHPLYRLTGAATQFPIASPETDTVYTVTFTDKRGCVSTDSVRVHRVTHLTLKAAPDTSICQGDEVTLRAAGGKYAYTWTDADGAVAGRGQEMETLPQHSGTYIIEATLGTCEAKDSMRVTVLPYPHIRVTADTFICHGGRVRLQATGGVFYKWSPAETLSDPTARAPFASPAATTTYTVTATDTAACPEPAIASVRVRVMPAVPAFAGHDTVAVLGKPFQLHATGGDAYVWSPATGLSDPYIADPVVTADRDMTYKVRVAYQPEGCFAYDTIQVRFLKGPALDVPTAFTPNGDGRNDILRPIAAGIAHLDYFQVYDRWGRMVYRTRTLMQGWNGAYGSGPAPAGAYVWMAAGKDDKGKPVSREGSVLLIR